MTPIKISFEYGGLKYKMEAKIEYKGDGIYEFTKHKCNEDVDINYFYEDGYWSLSFLGVNDRVVEAEFKNDTLELKNLILWSNNDNGVIEAAGNELENITYNGEGFEF